MSRHLDNGIYSKNFRRALTGNLPGEAGGRGTGNFSICRKKSSRERELSFSRLYRGGKMDIRWFSRLPKGDFFNPKGGPAWDPKGFEKTPFWGPPWGGFFRGNPPRGARGGKVRYIIDLEESMDN